MTNTVFLCLGGNLGDREGNLHKAIELLKANTGNVIRSSSVYETASWGNTGQPAYLNQVVEIRTKLSAPEVLTRCLFIEKELGRIRNVKWENRLIDIDILFFNNDIINQSELKVPHPLMQERLFVLQPLNEIAPYFIHPVSGKKVSELLDECQDQLKVTRL